METRRKLERGSRWMSLPALALSSDDATANLRVRRIERLYVLHHRTVFRWALRYGAGDEAFAEDVVQEVFVRLLRTIDRLEHDEDLGRWLYRVTANLSLSILRRRRIRDTVLEAVRLSEPASSRIDDRLDARETLEGVLETMRSMPPKERIVFSMLHLDGMQQTEIAHALGYSKGYVSKLVRRAQTRVEKAGWTVSP